MNVFLSFLTVEVIKIEKHLGDATGWTLYENEDLKLRIGGGIVYGIDYLDTLQFGNKLSNPYNNYVNPFFIFDILTKEGQSFFINYYMVEIDEIVTSCQNAILNLKTQLSDKESLLKQLSDEIAMLQYNCQ